MIGAISSRPHVTKPAISRTSRTFRSELSTAELAKKCLYSQPGMFRRLSSLEEENKLNSKKRGAMKAGGFQIRMK